MKKKLSLLLAVMALGLAGCASNPIGIGTVGGGVVGGGAAAAAALPACPWCVAGWMAVGAVVGNQTIDAKKK